MVKEINERTFLRYDAELFSALYADLEAQQNTLSSYACHDKKAVRRVDEKFHVARPNFVKDTERILNCRYFNRYADKTQVFSLYKNDDISRRILHVQIVSRIARNIGRMLKLNPDLIEAISLGHDLGHTPFGHAGERVLSNIYNAKTGKKFHHNVHSVRILDNILQLNISLQTLDGILCHNGETVRGQYYPNSFPCQDNQEKFERFDKIISNCYSGEQKTKNLVPSTLEGCVVRISDMIAYLGKDRQDAAILGIEIKEPFSRNKLLGATNSEFISNIIANIISNSYGKEYLSIDDEFAEALLYEKNANYKLIYMPQDKTELYKTIEDMFIRVYDKLYADLHSKNENSPIYRHHINKIFMGFSNEEVRKQKYVQEENNQIVVDYIASMTDDYFMDVHEYLFPNKVKLNYESYFSDV